MDFKSKILKHKKLLISSIIAVALAGSIQNPFTISMEEYNSNKASSVEVNNELKGIESEIKVKNAELKLLKENKNILELQMLEKEEREKDAKEKAENEESERLEKERLEKEKEEQEKKAEQERIANNNSNKSQSTENKNIQSSNKNNNSNKGNSNNNSSSSSNEVKEPTTKMVWKTATGSKYHSKSKCGNTKTSWQVTLQSAKASGLTACSKCY